MSASGADLQYMVRLHLFRFEDESILNQVTFRSTDLAVISQYKGYSYLVWVAGTGDIMYVALLAVISGCIH